MFDTCDATDGAAEAGPETDQMSLDSPSPTLAESRCLYKWKDAPLNSRLWRGDASLACATMRSTTAPDNLSILRDTTLEAWEDCERASQFTEGVAWLPREGVGAADTTTLRDLSRSKSSAMTSLHERAFSRNASVLFWPNFAQLQLGASERVLLQHLLPSSQVQTRTISLRSSARGLGVCDRRQLLLCVASCRRGATCRGPCVR